MKIDLTAFKGLAGILATIGLAQFESIAAIAAGTATTIYMGIKIWQAVRCGETE